MWAYSGNRTPPLGEIFLWGICLLSVFHGSILFLGKGERKRGKYATWGMVLVLGVLPLIGFILTWKFIISVDWMKYFDLHSVVALVPLASVAVAVASRVASPWMTLAVGSTVRSIR